MTEVTGVREQGRPRPLGLLKDNIQYYKLTSKFTNTKEVTEETNVNRKRNGNNQKLMKGPLQQATLINIVAAVNEHSLSHKDANIVPGSPTDALSNTMAVVSSIVSPRERTISIPTTQVVFEMPEETIQKKPVYYKHSEDEEVHRKDSTVNLFSKVSFEKTKVSSAKPHITSEKAMKLLQVRAPCFDNSGQKTDTNTSKPSASKSWSPVRRLGAWKRSESRAVHKMSKCEAVDIMDNDSIRRSQNDTGFSPDPTKLSAEEKLKIIPPSPASPYPFYRAKSLPAVFPVKTTKTGNSSHIMESQKVDKFKIRPLSRGYFSQTADIKKVINLSASVGLNHSNTGSVPYPDREIFSPYRLDLEKSKDALRSSYSLSGSDVSPAEVRGKAFGQGSPRHGIITIQYSLDSKFKSDDLSQSKENIYPGIKFATGGRPASTGSTASSKSQSSNRTSSTSKKGCLANKKALGFVAGRRTPKRVKFARRPNSTNSALSNSTLDDEPVGKINAFGGSSIVQIPKSNATAYSPGPQPLSAEELLRLKQKFIPANVRLELPHNTSYNFSNQCGMKIKSMHKTDSEESEEIIHDPCKKATDKTDANKLDSDKTDSDKASSVKATCNAERVDSNISGSEFDLVKDNTDELSVDITEDNMESEDKFKRLISDLDDDSDVSDSIINMSEPDTTQELSYKLVKAVDIESYAEFEHKKMRKVLNNSFNASRNENPKTHFLKVKLKEGE